MAYHIDDTNLSELELNEIADVIKTHKFFLHKNKTYEAVNARVNSGTTLIVQTYSSPVVCFLSDARKIQLINHYEPSTGKALNNLEVTKAYVNPLSIQKKLHGISSNSTKRVNEILEKQGSYHYTLEQQLEMFEKPKSISWKELADKFGRSSGPTVFQKYNNLKKSGKTAESIRKDIAKRDKVEYKQPSMEEVLETGKPFVVEKFEHTVEAESDKIEVNLVGNRRNESLGIDTMSEMKIRETIEVKAKTVDADEIPVDKTLADRILYEATSTKNATDYTFDEPVPIEDASIKGSLIITASTPSGNGNEFKKLYDTVDENDENPKNDFEKLWIKSDENNFGTFGKIAPNENESKVHIVTDVENLNKIVNILEIEEHRLEEKLASVKQLLKIYRIQ